MNEISHIETEDAPASESGQEVAVADERQVVAHEPDTTAPGSLLSAIVSLARDKSIDLEKLTFLMGQQRLSEEKQAERMFNAAMTAAQSEIIPVVRKAENKQTNSKYAKLEAVDAAIRPIYIQHGFSVSYGQRPAADGNVEIICYVAHVGGHTKEYSMTAPPDTLGPKGTPVKTALHGLGSTTTFLRRYLVCGAFNVVFRDDDDGNRGGMKLINQDQVGELVRLTKEAGREEGALLQRLFGGEVHRFEEIEAPAFVVVKNTLEGIINQRRAKSAAS